MPFKHARTTRVKLLCTETSHKEAFAQGRANFYTKEIVYIERIGFIQRSVYTEKLLQRESCYAKEPLDTLCRAALTEAITQSRPLHREAFIQRIFETKNFCTEQLITQSKPLHREASTQRNLYTKNLLHTEALTQRNCYTKQALHRARFYTEKLSRKDSFYTKPAFMQSQLLDN